MTCERCDVEMEYHPAEPDVGLMISGWSCPACDEDGDTFIQDEGPDGDDYEWRLDDE